MKILTAAAGPSDLSKLTCFHAARIYLEESPERRHSDNILLSWRARLTETLGYVVDTCAVSYLADRRNGLSPARKHRNTSRRLHGTCDRSSHSEASRSQSDRARYWIIAGLVRDRHDALACRRALHDFVCRASTTARTSNVHLRAATIVDMTNLDRENLRADNRIDEAKLCKLVLSRASSQS